MSGKTMSEHTVQYKVGQTKDFKNKVHGICSDSDIAMWACDTGSDAALLVDHVHILYIFLYYLYV